VSQPKPFRTIDFAASDRVALGRYRPRAPTDPYVPALEHTAPHIMDLQCVCKPSGRCGPVGAGNVAAAR
jgi:hypothetical protein